MKLEPDQDKLMKKMLYHLETSDEGVQSWIMRVMEEQGPKASSGVPILRRVMQENPDIWVRKSARNALEKIAGESLPPIDELNANEQSETVTPPPLQVASPTTVQPVVKATKVSMNSTGALDISVESHDAFENKWKGKKNRKSGEFARYGAWDSGMCHGDDEWMCGGLNGYETGCERAFLDCASGIAVASESYICGI